MQRVNPLHFFCTYLAVWQYVDQVIQVYVQCAQHWGPCIKYVRSEGEGNWEIGKYCRWTMLIGWVKCRQNEEGGKHPENFVNIFNGRPLAQGGCYVKWARSCHVVPKQSDWWLVTMQVALSDLPPPAHTARISRVSLIEMAHRIWVRELNGYAKIYI